MTEQEFKKNYPEHYSIDVKWGEMDAMQHVNNINFFRYFESSRMNFWASLEKNAQGKVEKHVGPILGSTSCRFRKPLYYPDRILVASKVIKIDEDRFTLEHVIWSEREQGIAAEGDAVIVSYDYHSKKKTPLPKAWIEFLKLESK